MDFDPRALLRRMFDAAQPPHCSPPHAPDARASDDHWRGEMSGLVVTRDGYGDPCGNIEIVEAADPAPDAVLRLNISSQSAGLQAMFPRLRP